MAPAMPHVEGVEHRYAVVDGFRMHYAEAGAGEPVILQHGWPQHWWAWRNQIPALAERYRVIVPDLRGYGWSEAPRGGYEKARFAQDVIALMDQLGIETARFAGHDWGAVAAYLLGLRHPERFERLVAIGAPPPWRSGAPPPHLFLFLTYQTLVSSPVLGALAMRNGLAKRMLGAGRKNGEFTEEELRIYDEPWSLPGHARAGVLTYRTFLTKELPGTLTGRLADQHLTVPTLVMVGGSDLIRKSLDPETYEKKADDIRTVIVDNAAHWVLEEQPDEVTRHLLDFFA
jgi:pimeloyl-ACP methyl ester carboxylesterase